MSYLKMVTREQRRAIHTAIGKKLIGQKKAEALEFVRTATPRQLAQLGKRLDTLPDVVRAPALPRKGAMTERGAKLRRQYGAFIREQSGFGVSAARIAEQISCSRAFVYAVLREQAERTGAGA